MEARLKDAIIHAASCNFACCDVSRLNVSSAMNDHSEDDLKKLYKEFIAFKKFIKIVNDYEKQKIQMQEIKLQLQHLF